MEHTSTATALAASFGLSANIDAGLAAEQVCEQASAGVKRGETDLALLFVSGKHTGEVEQIASIVRQSLEPGTLVGVTAEGVVGGDAEVERTTAISLLTLSLPGTSLHTFAYRDLPHVKDGDASALAKAAEVTGMRRDARGILFFADPFSVPAAAAVDVIARAKSSVEGLKRCPVVGGMASASSKPGGNALILNDQITRAGGFGVTIRGDLEVDCVVSQGCKPIGKPLIVTGAQRNVIKTLGGEKALDVLRQMVSELPEEDRALLPNGVFVGRVIDEYKPRFGRGDFLIRGVLGVDQQTGAIAIGDLVRPGQTVQFHLRDARTAAEDLELLLAAQQLQHPPAGGLLATCNGRGTRLFPEPGHDARAISKALSPDPENRAFPLAGFFAAGEIGPIGASSFLHGHTASLALFRAKRRVHDGG